VFPTEIRINIALNVCGLESLSKGGTYLRKVVWGFNAEFCQKTMALHVFL
jgi:hypothetical protein